MGYIKILGINIKYFQNKKYKLKIRKFWVHIDLKFSTSVTTKKRYLFVWFSVYACMCVLGLTCHGVRVEVRGQLLSFHHEGLGN